MDRSEIAGWIGGPLPEGQAHRGQRLGLPAEGPGSMAGTGRRVVALLIDWLAALAIARALLGGDPTPEQSLLTMGIFAGQVCVLTWLSGASFGQRLVGVRVVGRTGRLGLGRTALRTLLICLVVPALVWDADGRGLHDRAADSVVVRA